MSIHIFGYYLMVINLIAFAAFGIDKLKAVRDGWRISEKTLMGLAVVGGSVGALIGMKVFRHKTRKRLFRIGVPLILVAQAAAVIWLIVG